MREKLRRLIVCLGVFVPAVCQAQQVSPVLYLWPETGDPASMRLRQTSSALLPDTYKLDIPMAEARDWIIRGEAAAANTSLDEAVAVFTEKWSAANNLNRTAVLAAFSRRDGGLAPWDSDPPSKLSRLCVWHSLIYGGATGGTGVNQAACYYVVNFMIPAERAELQLQGGDHAAALTTLFTLYHLTTFTGVSTVNALESAYGSGTPAGFPSYNTTSMGANTFGKILSNGTVRTVSLHNSDKAAVTLRAAAIYADWGDELYRMGAPTTAKSKYLQVLRIYSGIWGQVIAGNVQNSVDLSELRLVLRAHAQLTKISNGLNFLGYRDDHVPVWDYHFLRDAATYFVREAKGLERDALSFLSSAEDATQQQALLAHQAAVAKLTVGLEKAKVAVEQTSVTIAQQSLNLAELKHDNMVDQIAEFANHHPIASATGIGAAVGFLQDPGSYTGEFGRTVGEIGGYVGSIFGWSTSGSIQRAEKEEQYHQMQREEKELALAVTVAQTELTRATQSLNVAVIGQHIAEVELTQATAATQFSVDRVLNAEFWYRMSKHMRVLSHRYLDNAITLAWLTEQAYEFEENDQMNVIRFDYLSRNDWLAADQLLFDLDVIEYRRITSHNQKEVHVSHVISLQNKDLIELDRLRSTGQLRFSTTESELDLAYPGTYNRRIDSVEVVVVALAGPGGIRGRLTKGPISWLKYPTGAAGASALPNTFDDWLRYTPTNFRVRMIKGQPETMILSARDSGSSVLASAGTTGMKQVFQDQPVSGIWLLQLPKSANDFDYSTIVDVLIKIHFTGHFDEGLRDAIVLERRKLFALGESKLGSVTGFSARSHFPDQFYDFFNPRGDPAISAQTRLLSVDIPRSAFPPNQVSQRLTDFWLAAVGKPGVVPAKMKVTSNALNPGKAISVVGGQLYVNGAPAALASVRWFPDAALGEAFENLQEVSRTANLAGAGATLVDRWIVRMDAVDNPSFANASGAFDVTKLKTLSDVMLQYAYQYDLPGIEGSPVTTWAHFNEATAQYRKAGGPSTGTAWVGAGWTVNSALGVLEFNGTAVQDMTTAPGDQLFAPDFELSLDAALDSAAQFRLRLEGTGPAYVLRIDRSAANSYTYEVARISGSNTTVVSQGPFVPDGDMLRLRVSGRQTGTGAVLHWFAGDQELASASLTTSHNFGMIRLRAAANRVRVDNVLVADLTGR